MCSLNSSDDERGEAVMQQGDTEDGTQAKNYAMEYFRREIWPEPSGGDGIDPNGDLNISGNIVIDGPV